MTFKYPTGRLLIFSLLHNDGISCSDALIKGARIMGLLNDEDLPNSNNGSNGRQCGSLIATEQIVQGYFQQRHKEIDESQRANVAAQVISRIEKDVESYKSRTGLIHPKTDLPQPLDCSNMAPFVFDFILQHLERHY